MALFVAFSLLLILPVLGGNSCNGTDANILKKHDIICSSLVGPNTWWCKYNPSVPANHDWPHQAIYMVDLLELLEKTPKACQQTPVASQTLSWLNNTMTNTSLGGSFFNTWVIFQVNQLFVFFCFFGAQSKRIHHTHLHTGPIL